MKTKKIILINLMVLLFSCGQREDVYTFLVKNNTNKKIEVIISTAGDNGIGQVSTNITTVIPSGIELSCFEHICYQEQIKNGKILPLKKWEFIKGIEVVKDGYKSNKDYLNTDINFYYMEGILGVNQGIYTITVEESDFN